MWIVRFALARPHTFVIVAVLIAIFGTTAMLTTPVDILPDINIPVVSVIWTYTGLDADEMSKQIVGVCKTGHTDHGQQCCLPRVAVLIRDGRDQGPLPNRGQVDLAISQVTALAQSVVHLMPPRTLPPCVLKYDASSVPIVQVSLGGKGLSQTELYDLGQNFIRGQLGDDQGHFGPAALRRRAALHHRGS